MDSGHPAIDALLTVGFVAPVAVYFLLLGLVNSHARPYMISSREDFISLTCVMVPLLLAPVPALAQSGAAWLLAVELLLAGWGFLSLLPARRAGWVIYNISAARCRAVVEACIRESSWGGKWHGDTWQGSAGRVHLTSLPLLRNASIHLELTGPSAESNRAALQTSLASRFAQIAQLPSTTGVCLLMLGVGMLIMPIWMMGRHIQDVVEAVNHLFG